MIWFKKMVKTTEPGQMRYRTAGGSVDGKSLVRLECEWSGVWTGTFLESSQARMLAASLLNAADAADEMM